MGTIRLSQGQTNSASIKTYEGNGAPFANAEGSYGYNSNWSKFYIMQGSIPTQNELDAAGGNFRSGDRLVTFDRSWGHSLDDSNNTVTLVGEEATATGTGTATWWYWDAHVTQANACRMAGDISGIGGGGSIEMSNTSVVSGNVYQTAEHIFSFPYEFTY